MHTAQRMLARRWGMGIGRVAVALLALFLISSVALAAVPTTGTFAGKDNAHGQFVKFTLPGRNTVITDWAGVLQLQLDKDTKGDRQGPMVKVFCIQLFVVVGRPGSIDTYYSNGSVTALKGGCQIRYLLAHYPAASVATQAEGAARQLAIWHFSDDLDLTTIQDAAIRARALALAAEAQADFDANGCLGTNAGLATLTLTPANATAPQGQPVQFTVQLTPAGAATTVNISVDGTARLDNGTQQASLPLIQGAATFNVTNPGVGVANITAQVPYIMDEGTVFDSDKRPPTQRLVLGDSISLTAAAQVQSTWQQATPTETPTGPTATPTETPTGPTATPTETPTGPTATPTETPTGPTATPTNTPRQPTKTPGRGPDITPTSTQTVENTPTPDNPGGGETPTATPGGDMPTATPGGETPVGTPGNGETPVGTLGPDQPPSQALQPNAARPRSLPNTAAGPDGRAAEWLLALAAALVIAGLALQRRGARR